MYLLHVRVRVCVRGRVRVCLNVCVRGQHVHKSQLYLDIQCALIFMAFSKLFINNFKAILYFIYTLNIRPNDKV